MKTAISIPGDVFEAAERLARQLGVSRSELYATALRLYLDKWQESEVTRQLNVLYTQEDSSLAAALARLQLARLQSASLPREDWE